jgi:hypothetical protein
VEAFKKKEGTEAALPEPEKSLISAHAWRQDVTPVVQPVSPLIGARVSAPESSPARKSLARFRAVWRFAAVLAIAVAVVFAAVSFDLLGMKGNIVINQPTSILPKAAPLVSPQSASATDSPLAAPSPALPTSFGIYAVSQDKLYELDLLPGRAPDMRVAISPLITTHSRTTLPDGHLTFIVYRRDSAINAADRAEVRLIARIAREMSFDKDGKQIASEAGDNWVMRNISIRYRTAPKKDNPDMYEVQSENPDTPLPPGRYALVLKGQAYDFSVAGLVTDPRQCLERLVATNGQFYSECKKQ